MGHNWWVGNWWSGGGSSPSFTPGEIGLDERIMQLVAPALGVISLANGYHQDVTVQRPPVAAYEYKATECPVLVVRRAGKAIRAHIRKAEEFILTVQVICIVDNTTADPYGDLSNLMGDAKRVVYLNRRWNDGNEDLARRTYFTDDTFHEPEVTEETLTASFKFDILARADREDLTAVKEV